jgi:hypothetical protein
MVIELNWFFDFLRSKVIQPRNHPDNFRGSAPLSDNRPILEPALGSRILWFVVELCSTWLGHPLHIEGVWDKQRICNFIGINIVSLLNYWIYVLFLLLKFKIEINTVIHEGIICPFRKAYLCIMDLFTMQTCQSWSAKILNLPLLKLSLELGNVVNRCFELDVWSDVLHLPKYYIRVQEPGRHGNGKDRRSSFKISKLKSHQQQARNYQLLVECETLGPEGAELEILVSNCMHCQSNCTDLSVTCRSRYNLGPTSYVACIATWRWYYLQIQVLI